MMLILLFAGFCLIAYLCGSVSFAIITTKAFTGDDVRDSGSGNAGMTNVMRTAGFLPGVITFFGDFIKAVAAVSLGKHILPELVERLAPVGGDMVWHLPVYGALFTGFFCLLGHMFPVFFGFRGGKGIVTAAGAMLILDWRILVMEIAVFALLFLITRIISVGSLAAALVYPLTAWICFGLFPAALPDNFVKIIVEGSAEPPSLAVTVPLAVACTSLLVIVKHKDNVKRLFKGEEKKLTLKKSAKAESNDSQA